MEIKIKSIVEEKQLDKSIKKVVYFEFVENGKIVGNANTYYDEKDEKKLEEFLKKKVDELTKKNFIDERNKINTIISSVVKEE